MENLNNNKKLNQGFTLIELIISITIFFVLATASAPLLSGYITELGVESDQEQFKNAILKARSFARVNNRPLVLINEADRIRLVTNTDDVIGVFPIKHHAITFKDSNGDEITALNVTSSGTFNDEHNISFFHDDTIKTVALLRSGRFSAPVIEVLQ